VEELAAGAIMPLRSKRLLKSCCARASMIMLPGRCRMYDLCRCYSGRDGGEVGNPPMFLQDRHAWMAKST